MEQFFSPQNWEQLYKKLMNWTFSELPSILIITLIVIVSIRIISYSLHRFKKLLIKRSQIDPKLDSIESEKRINTISGILSGLIKIMIWSVYFMIVLKKLGIDIGPILASAGILGLALGFGAQELVRDFISGFFIILENQVRTGDVAIIDGVEGLVEKIELRTITVRDFSGTIHIFQNGKINTLANMTKEWSAVVLNIGVAYKEEPDDVIRIMKQVGQEILNDPEYAEFILEPIEVLGLNEFGASEVIIKARFKTKPSYQWKVGREYRKRLKKQFDLNNIEIPFPHTTIYWGDEIKPLKVQMGNTDQN